MFQSPKLESEASLVHKGSIQRYGLRFRVFWILTKPDSCTVYMMRACCSSSGSNLRGP